MTIALACSLIRTFCPCCNITYLTTACRGAGEERNANTEVVEGKYLSPVLYFSSCLVSLHREKKVAIYRSTILIVKGCAT